MVDAKYRTVLHESAHKEFQELSVTQRQRLRETIKAVAKCESPLNHEKTKHLSGQGDKFRIRVGELRAVCSLDKPRLVVWAIATRAKAYRNIDEKLSERA